MIIRRAGYIPPGDVHRFAWGGLAQFQNLTHITSALVEVHAPPNSQSKNVKKQAQQIRYCLSQAREYFHAASSVSMSTRPLLLYYGVMSLALAEILFKGTGDVSLDRARGQHAHHGLDLRLDLNPSSLHPLSESAKAIRAVPLVRTGGERFGTFELWHRTAREYPIIGNVKTFLEKGGSHDSFEAILIANDERLPTLSEDGISLLDCFRSHPAMSIPLFRNSVTSSTCRVKFERDYRESDDTYLYRVVFQPSPNSIEFNKCLELTKFHPSAVYRANISEYPSWCSINWESKTNDRLGVSFPMGTQEYVKEANLQSEIESLNEFGIIYAAAFMLGNYVRYFPDQWMVDVETASPLAVAAEAFCEIIERRAPLLCLSELSRMFFVLS